MTVKQLQVYLDQLKPSTILNVAVSWDDDVSWYEIDSIDTSDKTHALVRLGKCTMF